jgi:hypothetical protein
VTIRPRTTAERPKYNLKPSGVLMSAAPINPSAATPRTDLQTRVENRKRDLISEIVEHKKNSSRAGAADAIERVKAHLTELAQIVKENVTDGWGNVSPTAKLKLDEWMAR